MDYINTFLKIKAEASGYPSLVRSPEVEERFIDSFEQGEGIRLDRESIKFNAAKRGLAKLCLNSMWGKLTERNDRERPRLSQNLENCIVFWPRPTSR